MRTVPATPPWPRFVIEPTLIALATYVLTLRVVSLHVFSTLRFRVLGEPPADRAVVERLAATLTTIHVAFALLLAWQLWDSRPGRARLQGGRFCGALAGLAVVAVAQLAVGMGLETFDLLQGVPAPR